MITNRYLNGKGYTLLELMITLLIFAIISLFAIPAFTRFIERSRVQTQITQAASFLRSAQEIATSTNRTVYVYTDGYFNYNDDNKDDYWYQNWVMSFKPIGKNINSGTNMADISDIENVLQTGDEYLIARQNIFTPSIEYQLYMIDSKNHNSVNLASVTHNTQAPNTILEMDGYSVVRKPSVQGGVVGQPTFLVFYPSGEVIMPIFILAKTGKNNTFGSSNSSVGSQVNTWATFRDDYTDIIGILAGCRTGQALTIDSINYTFNTEVMQNNLIFSSNLQQTSGSIGANPPKYMAAPSFGPYLCGSKFLL